MINDMSILYNLYIVYLTLFSVLFFPSCYILSNNGYEINNDRHKWIHFQDLLIIMFNSLDVYILKIYKVRFGGVYPMNCITIYVH